MSILDKDTNIKTNYPLGYWFTIGYVEKRVVDIRQDEDGLNEYLLNDGRWVTGRWITFNTD